MRWLRHAASMITLTALIAGCGGLRELQQRLHHESTAVQSPSISTDEVVAKARLSVAKVHGEAESCQKITDGRTGARLSRRFVIQGLPCPGS